MWICVYVCLYMSIWIFCHLLCYFEAEWSSLFWSSFPVFETLFKFKHKKPTSTVYRLSLIPMCNSIYMQVWGNKACNQSLLQRWSQSSKWHCPNLRDRAAASKCGKKFISALLQITVAKAYTQFNTLIQSHAHSQIIDFFKLYEKDNRCLVAHIESIHIFSSSLGKHNLLKV